MALSPFIAKGNWGIELEQLVLHHLRPTTNGPRCARLDLRYFGPLDIRRHHHIPDPMLEEDILCRLGGTVLTTTPPLLGCPRVRYTSSVTLAEMPEGEFKAS